MDLSDHIDSCIAGYVNNEYDFKTACDKIAEYPCINLVNFNRLSAIFELTTKTFKTRIIINNDNLTAKHDPDFILKKVSLASGIPVEAMKKRTRKREIVEARHAFYLINMELKEQSGITLEDIAKITHQDHASVLHAKKNEHLHSIQQIIQETKKYL